LIYVWRNVFQRKIRSGLSMLGVSVSVAGVVALISVSHGMRASVDEYMSASGASLLVFTAGVSDLSHSKVTQAEVDRIEAMEGVDDVSRVHFSDYSLPGLPTIFLFGRYPNERIMQKYRRFLVAGRLLERPNEIMVSRLVADALNVKVGTKVPVFGTEYEIVGIYESDVPWENGGIVIHADVLARQLGRKDNYTLVFVYTSDEARDRVAARIESEFPQLRAIPPREFTNTFRDQLAIIDEFVALITVIALVVGVLGVLNTMMMSVSERTREIGTLRALGWSRARVVRAILVEGLLLSCLGGAFGLVLGVAGTEVLVRLWNKAYLDATYEPSTFVKGALVALVVGILAAVYPAYRAASLRPVEALRYE